MALLDKINHFVVLMLENRSFDHVFGYRQGVDGVLGRNFANLHPGGASYPVTDRARHRMPFDPGHELSDVQMQMYGFRRDGKHIVPNPPTSPLEMKGFVASSSDEPNVGTNVGRVMDCFQPDQVRTLNRLADEFALFNYWYSSVPGPTWPNRFFVHAATARGYTRTPSATRATLGFQLGTTIFDRLNTAGLDWRIYQSDILPNVLGIREVRDLLVRDSLVWIDRFEKDIRDHTLPAYSFIEPAYDFNHNYRSGNSTHPLGDIRDGEDLIKYVYDKLKASEHYWKQSLLVVTFIEHGGFYDHVAPPEAVPPDKDMAYADPAFPFAFNRLGPRVPTIVVSAYTKKGTVIGDSPDQMPAFDHTSILRTLAQRFKLPPLTERDKAAPTIEAALNFPEGRLKDGEAPWPLKSPNRDRPLSAMIRGLFVADAPPATPEAPLTTEQRASLGLAYFVDQKLAKNDAERAAAFHRYSRVRKQADFAQYVEELERRAKERR